VGIQIRNVQKRFGEITVVNRVSVDIAEGEFFVMLGESGCGKTTTLRMVAGLELPTSGSVHINGRDVTFAEPRHRDIAMAFQDYGLYPNMTVFENIAFPLKIRKVPQSDRKRKVEETAGKLGIADYLGRKPFQLSGGQRQRVSLARALVRNPKVFLMDEPLSNLDAKLRAVMRTEIKKLVSELGITTIYVTHDQIEAMSMADRIAVMRRGDMVQIGSPMEIYDRPLTRFVADFMGSPPMNLFPAVMKTPGQPTCQIQEFVDTLPITERELIAARLDPAHQFTLGIRPEHLKLVQPGSPGSVRAVVDFVEPLGQTTNVYLAIGDTRLIAVTDRCASHVGDVVGVYAPPESVRVVAN
jgi:ABC-type sugar transport system ATPase subunit